MSPYDIHWNAITCHSRLFHSLERLDGSSPASLRPVAFAPPLWSSASIYLCLGLVGLLRRPIEGSRKQRLYGDFAFINGSLSRRWSLEL